MRRHLAVLSSLVLSFSAIFATAQPAKPPASAHPFLADVVVTDKQGNYVHGLGPSDFKFSESGHELAVSGLQSGAERSELQRVVLVLDQVQSEDQTFVRELSATILAQTASAHRSVALLILQSDGNLRLLQNFTSDLAQLQQAIRDVKTTELTALSRDDQSLATFQSSRIVVSSSSPIENRSQESDLRVTSAANREEAVNSVGELRVRSELWSLQSLARSLAKLPGRKSLVLFTPGFFLDDDQNKVLNALIEACNRGNVSVYPIQTRFVPMYALALRSLATETGGFVPGSNDEITGAIHRIELDQSESYLLSLDPSLNNSCHRLTVKTVREGLTVRTRKQQCSFDPSDVLAGTTSGRDLESRLDTPGPGNLKAQMRAPFFYVAKDRAIVDLVAEIPVSQMEFTRRNGRFESTLNVLATAYSEDGSIGAHFTDAVEFAFRSREDVERFKSTPYPYRRQFPVTPGGYDLKAVFASGRDYARLQAPLVIPPYEPAEFALSGVALCREFRAATSGSAPDALIDATPLISRGVRFLPSANVHMKKSDPAALYFEIYDPHLAIQSSASPSSTSSSVNFQLKMLDLKTSTVRVDTGRVSAASWARPGNATVPVALKLSVSDLPAGSYLVQVRAVDSEGRATQWRSAAFELE